MGHPMGTTIDRADFREILLRARAIDARLSGEPADYRVESVGLKGEVAGDAQIGYNVEHLSISITRP